MLGEGFFNRIFTLSARVHTLTFLCGGSENA